MSDKINARAKISAVEADSLVGRYPEASEAWMAFLGLYSGACGTSKAMDIVADGWAPWLLESHWTPQGLRDLCERLDRAGWFGWTVKDVKDGALVVEGPSGLDWAYRLASSGRIVRLTGKRRDKVLKQI